MSVKRERVQVLGLSFHDASAARDAGKSQNSGLKMPVWSRILRPLENPKTAKRVVTLRSERGYSDTKHDGSAVNPEKTLVSQIGRFYDQN